MVRKTQLATLWLDYFSRTRDYSHSIYLDSPPGHNQPPNVTISIDDLLVFFFKSTGIKANSDIMITALGAYGFVISKDMNVRICDQCLMLTHNPDSEKRSIKWLKKMYHDHSVDLSQIETPAGMARRWVDEVFIECEQRRAERRRKDCEKAARWRRKKDQNELKAMQRKWERTYRQRLKVSNPARYSAYCKGAVDGWVSNTLWSNAQTVN